MVAGAPRTVAVRFGQYQQLVERRRELEERLGRDGATRALDLVIARAHYDVKLGAESAAVTARFQVQTLRPPGWKLLPLVGGAVSVSRFVPPQGTAFLVVRGMLPALAPTLSPGTHYLLAEGSLNGELVLEFMVPAYSEGNVRRLQFVPPAVPLSTLEMTVGADDGIVSVDPVARVEELPGRNAGDPRRIRASLRGGEPLNVVLAKPEAPVVRGSGAPGQPPAPPAAELTVDQLSAHWALSDTRIRMRERLVVDVRAGTVDRIVLRKPAPLVNVIVREDVGSTLLEESSVGKALDPEGHHETLELKLRAPVTGRLVRLALTADLRAEPDAPELKLAPVTVEGARGIVEGYAAVSSQLPHALTLERAEGARPVPVDRLPLSFGPTDGPLLVVTALTAPAAVLTVKQQVLPRPRPISGAIQKLEVATDLSGSTIRTRYKALVNPGTEGTVAISLPTEGEWSLEEVRGTASSELPMVRSGTYLLHLKPGGAVPLEFEVKHAGEGLKGAGDVALPLARFNVPARNVSWTVQEPDALRLWGWRGSFAEVTGTPDVFLQRFAMGLWGWVGQALVGLAEPAAMFWLLLVLLGLTLARSAALGRLPLDASLGQIAFGAGIVVLGAVFVHVLTNAANPGSALSDGRGDARRFATDEALARPPAPGGHGIAAARLPEADEREARRNSTQDASTGGPTRMDAAAPVPQPGAAAPPPVATPLPVTAPPIRATSVDPMSRDLGGGLTGTGYGGPPAGTTSQMSAAPAPGGAPPAAPAAPEGRAHFTRMVVLPGEAPGLSLEVSFLERRWESVATALAMLVGLALFLSAFLAVRQMLDVPTTNVIAGLGVLILWLLDTRFPFTAPYAAAGFGLPVLLLGSVKVMGHALDTWDAWREEGERLQARPGAEAHATSESRSGSWSASFPRSGDRNEVPIKEIFAETPAAAAAAAGGAAVAGADEISFVTEEEDGPEAAGEAQGGEPQ